MQAHSIVVAGILQGIEAKQARFCSNLGFFVVIKVEGGSASHVKLFVPIVQCTHTQPTNPHSLTSSSSHSKSSTRQLSFVYPS